MTQRALEVGKETLETNWIALQQHRRTIMSSDVAQRDPVQRLIQTWVVSIMVPSALVAWHTTKHWSAAVGAALTGPMLAILQGSIQIWKYRFLFGEAPLPHVPCHGVVVVDPNDATLRDADEYTPRTDELLQQALEQPPLRVLIIGDSLAIGVGQSTSCTPILPEVLSKTLSKKMGGRAVFWTCHGAPGASAAWIVRELERGVEYLDKPDEDESLTDGMEVTSSCSDSECTTDDSSTETNERPIRTAQHKVWYEKLRRHKRRFDPLMLGPYDVIIVVTGANDLKSAFFPFLLTGDDVEFRKQAKQRGGNYPQELRRVLETLRSRMKSRLESLRISVEAATESVFERVEDTWDAIARGRFPNKSERGHLMSRQETEATLPETPTSQAHRPFPLVVLPGLSPRTLPVFRAVPLHWLAIPILDILDCYKRKLARSHPGEVVFAAIEDIPALDLYAEEKGPLWEQRVNEETLLSLHDVGKRDSQQTEAAMREYYKNGATYQGTSWLFRNPPHNRLLCVDGVHPNDLGYDFYGRYLGNVIFQELQKR